MWTTPGTVQVPTTTKLELNADGTGTITVSATGATPTNPVDLWVDSTWQRAYTLTDGKATIDLGTQTLGDHLITARYRESSTSGSSQTSVTWTAPGTVQATTTTTLKLNADGTGTITVTSTGATPTNPVDLWVDSTWQRAYTLTNGQATIDIGTQTLGDHRITVRYRDSSLTAASQDSRMWTTPGTVQVPTTTKLTLNADGTGTVKVTSAGPTAVSPTNPVDLWIDSTWQRAYTLTKGTATFRLRRQAGADHLVPARSRPSSTSGASQASVTWSVDTAPKPGAAACGAPVSKADGSPWTCTFADNFGGNTLDRTKWKVQTDFVSGDTSHLACYVDSRQNVSVSDGALQLTVRKGEPRPCPGQSAGLTPYTSGMVTTWHTWSQQYGRFEARVKTTATTLPGLHEAFWLWPDDRYPEGQGTWPANGEIDVAETYSKYANLVVPYLHTALDTLSGILTGPTTNTSWRCTAQRGVFNTYTLEWSPSRVEVFVNGRSCLVNTSGSAAFKKRYIMALTQGLGSQAGNNPVDGTPIPATMTVDYVRAWS